MRLQSQSNIGRWAFDLGYCAVADGCGRSICCVLGAQPSETDARQKCFRTLQDLLQCAR